MGDDHWSDHTHHFGGGVIDMLHHLGHAAVGYEDADEQLRRRAEPLDDRDWIVEVEDVGRVEGDHSARRDGHRHHRHPLKAAAHDAGLPRSSGIPSATANSCSSRRASAAARRPSSARATRSASSRALRRRLRAALQRPLHVRQPGRRARKGLPHISQLPVVPSRPWHPTPAAGVAGASPERARSGSGTERNARESSMAVLGGGRLAIISPGAIL